MKRDLKTKISYYFGQNAGAVARETLEKLATKSSKKMAILGLDNNFKNGFEIKFEPQGFIIAKYNQDDESFIQERLVPLLVKRNVHFKKIEGEYFLEDSELGKLAQIADYLKLYIEALLVI